MSDLASKKCAPCTAKTPKVEPTKERMAEIPGWSVKDGRLFRAYSFPDFPAALSFVNRAGAIAEAEQHHPDLAIHDWNKVDVSIWTHEIGGLSENDFILAAKIGAR